MSAPLGRLRAPWVDLPLFGLPLACEPVRALPLVSGCRICGVETLAWSGIGWSVGFMEDSMAGLYSPNGSGPFHSSGSFRSSGISSYPSGSPVVRSPPPVAVMRAEIGGGGTFGIDERFALAAWMSKPAPFFRV